MSLVRTFMYACHAVPTGPQDFFLPLRSTTRGNRYFTVNGADAVTFSHSMSSFPLAPSAPDRVILRVSTGDDGLPMVRGARPSSVAGSLVVAPSRMPSGDFPTPQIWRPPAIRVLLTISFHWPLLRSAYRVYSPLGMARPFRSRPES